MRYLVDGYNVTMADDATRRLARGEQRLALVRRLAARRTELLGGRGRVTIVFDGAEDGAGTERNADIEVAFARGETADDVLVRAARASRESVVLVTSDRELAARVREGCVHEVEVRPASTLFEDAQGRARRRKGRLGGSTAGMPKGANRITEELKKIWLQDTDEE